MSDIVDRLTKNSGKYPGFENLKTEAAREIERLREEVKRWKAEAMAWRKASDEYTGDVRVVYGQSGHIASIVKARAANDAAREVRSE